MTFCFLSSNLGYRYTDLNLLVDPLSLALLVVLDLVRLEPEGDLLLGTLDAVGAVADVTANVLFFGQ